MNRTYVDIQQHCDDCVRQIASSVERYRERPLRYLSIAAKKNLIAEEGLLVENWCNCYCEQCTETVEPIFGSQSAKCEENNNR